MSITYPYCCELLGLGGNFDLPQNRGDWRTILPVVEKTGRQGTLLMPFQATLVCGVILAHPIGPETLCR